MKRMNAKRVRTMDSSSVASLLVVTGATLTSSIAMAQQASFLPLGDLAGGAFYSEANNLSADGRTVVGVGSDSVGLQPIVWRDGIASVLDKPAGYTQGTAAGVSDDGMVIVGSVGVYPNMRGVIWRDGGLQVVNPTATYSVGSALNDVSSDGTVSVGWCTTGAGFQAIRNVSGTTFPLATSGDTAISGVSSDGKVALGRVVSPAFSIYEACRWIENGPTVVMGDLPGGRALSASYDANWDGSVIVGVVNTAASQPSNEGEPGRWENGTWISLGDFPGGLFNGVATGVTDDGTIVVGRGTTAAGQEAFVWDSANGLRSLSAILSGQFGVDLTGWRITLARKISGDGTHVIGRAINPQGNTEAFVASVPCFVAPRVLEQPSSITVCIATEAVLSVGAGGGGTGQLSYAWRMNGVAMSDGQTSQGSTITGSDTASLSISQVTAQDAGTYDCIITNPCGEVMSMQVTLGVCNCLECPADFNIDGGIDGSDVESFFAAWEAGSCEADTNTDGGIDGSDVETFFVAWEAGGCG